MTKTIVGVIISSIALVLFAIFLQGYIENSSQKLSEKIDVVKVFVLTDQMELAKKNNRLLKEEWDSQKEKWEMIIDHIEIDNIEERVLNVEGLIEQDGMKVDIIAAIEVLQFYIEHIPEKEKFSLNNLL